MSNVSLKNGRNTVRVEYDEADALRERFNAAKERSRQRQDINELRQHEFLQQLLDVWELHEEREEELP